MLCQLGIGFWYNSVRYLFSKNIQGDIVSLHSDTGALLASYVYDAWGNHKVYASNGQENTEASFIGNVNPFRYRGYYYDVETKLYYLNSRYYDPEVGRFISPDLLSILDETMMDVNGLNLYMYCGNNPVMYVDSDGRSPKWWQWALFGIGVALVIAATTLLIVISLGAAAAPAGVLGAASYHSGIQWMSTRLHAASRMIERGINQNMVNTVLRTGKYVQQSVDKFLVIGRVTAVITTAGELITAWKNSNGLQAVIELLEKLFGG